MTSNQWKGAGWKVLSCLCFATINGLVKFLSARLSTESIAFFQNTLGFLWLLPFAFQGSQYVWRSQRLDLQMWRVLASCVGLLLWYKAVAKIPIGQAVALNFTGPLITVIGACAFLGERVTRYRLSSILIGFLGGSLIVNSRYLTGEIPWGSQGWEIFLPLASAAAFSICTLLNKRLTAYDSPMTIVIYLMGSMIPVLALFALPQMVWPSGTEWGILGALGLLSALANFAMSRSFVCSDVTFLLPFGSTRLLASTLIGFFFFSQAINRFVLMGFCIICVSLFVLARTEKR